MTVIPPTSSSTPAANTQAKNSNAGILGKDDFLKLFVAQLSHQDPMNPMNDQDMMGQMASFSQLEQITNMAAANQTIATSLSSSSAVSLIGRTVTYLDNDKVAHTGTVEKVTVTDGKPSLTVAGTDGVDPLTITQVA
jgi:flagellar basal-body rod modification protein FlgD